MPADQPLPADVARLVRPHLANLKPYSSARHEYDWTEGKGQAFLDANENPQDLWGGGLNRYPDPEQLVLKERLAELKGCEPEQIFLGSGSDEAIDLLIRAFCEPGADRILTLPPTYGMYRVQADIHGCGVDEVPLKEAAFQPDVDAVLAAAGPHHKLLFLCSPNNPTGNLMQPDAVRALLAGFEGIVVLDEAYMDFAPGQSWLPALAKHPRLVILQTMSKAWALAGARLGMAYAQPGIIRLLNQIKYPYNVNALTLQAGSEAVFQHERVAQALERILAERSRLVQALPQLQAVQHVYPSDANFLLVRVGDALGMYQHLRQQGIVVRDRSHLPGCAGCLRITIGTPAENDALLEALAFNH